jgi:hypothetical protein
MISSALSATIAGHVAKLLRQSKPRHLIPESNPVAFVLGRWAYRASIRKQHRDNQVSVATQYQSVSFSVGDRVHHQKFGKGTVSAVAANKLTVDFDRCGTTKRVIDAFVSLCAKSADIIAFPVSRIIRRVERGPGIVVSK